MSISAYTGLPGSGKSYEVVNSVILAAILRGRVVWTNIPCKVDGVRIIEGDEAKGHWYLNAPPGSLCVVDECWRYWPAGMKADAIPEAHRSWFAEHRHRTLDGVEADIVLVTQDLSQVARFVRDLVDQTFRGKRTRRVKTALSDSAPPLSPRIAHRQACNWHPTLIDAGRAFPGLSGRWYRSDLANLVWGRDGYDADLARDLPGSEDPPG